MTVVGISLGVGAAAAQAWSYLISRGFVLQQAGGSVRLLALAHIWMGLTAAVVLPLIWFEPAAGRQAMVLPLVIGLLAYLSAQACFYYTVRQIPASRVAPLMGVKIAILAGLVTILGVEQVKAWQWLAVALALGAVWLVRVAGPVVPLRAWIGLAGTVLSFATSDVAVKELIRAIDPDGGLAASCLAAAATYTLGLLVGLALLPIHGLPKRSELPGSMTYALAWGLGMICLYSAIGQAGVVLAILLQALRGPLTVIFGATYAWCRRDTDHHEQQFTKATLTRQIAAALVMVAASTIYVLAG